jgi:hypothetical protein
MRIISQFFQGYSQKPETNQLQSERCAYLKPPKQAPDGCEKKPPKKENQKPEIEEHPKKDAEKDPSGLWVLPPDGSSAQGPQKGCKTQED